MDAELTKKLYRAAPILIREAADDEPEQNPWGIRFQAMFHMSVDSGLFKTQAELSELSINGEPTTENYLPLYEAKMIHHYNHRWATYEPDGKTSRDCTLAERQDPAYCNQPRYSVAENEVTLRTARAPKAVLDASKKKNTETLTTALKHWTAGAHLALHPDKPYRPLLASLLDQPAQETSGDLFATDLPPLADAALQMQRDYPLSDEEYTLLARSLGDDADPWALVWPLLEARRPKYLLGWRDITNATNEHTVIAGVVPLSGVGDKFLLMFPTVKDKRKLACLLADQISLPHDFIARQKIGGTSFKYFTKKQIVNLPPEKYTETDLDYILPRILELTYTAHDLKPFAEDLGYTGAPFPFDPERRHQLKSELDAYYAKLYGLTRDELRYILDPTDVMGEDYPSETFRVLKTKEIKQYGEYRTQRLVLEAFDALSETEHHDQRRVANG